MFPETLESDRLKFHRLSQETVDILELHDVFTQPPHVDEVFEYLDTKPPQTPKETFEKVRRSEEKFESGESAQYVIRPKSDEDNAGEIAGVTGIYPQWDRKFATLGIILDKPYWGRGYSGERAETFLRLAFNRLDLDLVAVKFIDGNERSKRAVEKYVDRFNGRYEGLLRNWSGVDEEVYDCHRYSISRAEYESAKAQKG